VTAVGADYEVYYHGAASRVLAGAVLLREFAAKSGGDLPRSTPIRTEAT